MLRSIQLYPKGDSAAKDKNISMQLHASGNDRLAHYSLCVRNQDDSSKHATRTSSAGFRTMSARNQEHRLDMMPLSSLAQPGFVVDDCLEVSATVTAYIRLPEAQAKALALIAKLDGSVLEAHAKAIAQLLEDTTNTKVQAEALALLAKLEPEAYAAKCSTLITLAAGGKEVSALADTLLAKLEGTVVAEHAAKLLLGGAAASVEEKALALLEGLGPDALAAHADAIAHLLSSEELEYVWRIEAFSTKGEDKLLSPTFSSGKHSW